jgi:hypothetical protein
VSEGSSSARQHEPRHHSRLAEVALALGQGMKSLLPHLQRQASG